MTVILSISKRQRCSFLLSSRYLLFKYGRGKFTEKTLRVQSGLQYRAILGIVPFKVGLMSQHSKSDTLSREIINPISSISTQPMFDFPPKTELVPMLDWRLINKGEEMVKKAFKPEQIITKLQLRSAGLRMSSPT